MMNKRKTIYLDDALEAIRKLPNAGIHWYVSAEAVFDALLKLPSAEEDYDEALQMAIEALSNTPNTLECVELDNNSTKVDNENDELVRRQDAIETIHNLYDDDCFHESERDIGWNNAVINAVRKINELPSVHPEVRTQMSSADLIRRQNAIDAVCMEFCGTRYKDCQNPFNEETDEYYHCEGCYSVNILNDLPSAQPEQRWIPCSERLPEVRQWVLCQCRANIIYVLRLTKDKDWEMLYPHATYLSGFVLAWQPLPEPYKGGEQE